MTDSIPVGIDGLAFSGPAAYVELSDLATARGVDPAKFTKGLGQHRMAIASPCEDTVTMAVEAGAQALEAFDVDPEEIGTLIVGTETGVDHSKPVAVYVHDLLGLDACCRTFETKHACYGAMAGLTSSMDWIASGRARGRKALVIASDIANYGLGTPGEPTQGAGAVAMVVSQQPRLLEIQPASIGDYTRQVMDFWRPLYSKYALADGQYSIQCYLDALSAARNDAVGPRQDLIAGLQACLYHVPFVKMAFKAHQRELEVERGLPIDKNEPDAWQALQDSYAQRCAPWLTLNAEIGNIYTGSLFLSLIDLLRKAGSSLAGDQISLFSYGSGCGATYCLGTITQQAGNWRARLDPAAHLESRRRLSIEEYEDMVRDGEIADRRPQLNPADFGLSNGLYYTGTREDRRHYERI